MVAGDVYEMVAVTTAAATTAKEPVHRSNHISSRRWMAFLFLLPAGMILAVVAFWPLFRTIYFSFTDARLTNLGIARWLGFQNYLSWTELQSGQVVYSGLLTDMVWWQAVWNTVYFSFVSIFFETVFGMIIALVLNCPFRGRGLVRAAILIPWAIPTIVSARLWGWMLNDQFGILNDLFMRLGLLSHPVAWTASPDTAMIAVIIVDVWKTTPFMALLLLAGLLMIPREIYEVARVDGVHPVKQFFYLTLPLLRPALIVAIIFRMLDAMRIFDLIYVLTPNSSQTKTMSVLARENLIDFDKFSYGAAQSSLLFLILAFITIFVLSFGTTSLQKERP